MLDLLIASRKNEEIDDEGIQEEVDTFMFEVQTTVLFIFMIFYSFQSPCKFMACTFKRLLIWIFAPLF